LHNHHIRLSTSIRLDLERWQQFLPQFNGQTELIPSKPLSLNDFFTDASSSYGYGAFILGGYFSLSFAQAASQFCDAPEPSEPIHVHELYVVLILCRLFSAALRGLHIRLHIDNTIVVAVINKGTAKGTSGPRMMEYVRHIFWLSARYNFGLTSIYITSKNNSLADALSQGDLPRFSSLLLEWKLGLHSALTS
jgi:hypothetical protein